MRIKKGLVVFLFVFALAALSGCGVKVSNKTPEAVVKSLISAYQGQDQKAVKKCFGLKPDEEGAKEIKTEMEYNLKVFEAYDAEEVSFEKAESLGEFDGKYLVYVCYNYQIEEQKEKQKVPALSFYFVEKKDKKYYVVPAMNVTDKMTKISGKEYDKFTKTETYIQYDKAYQRFIRKNPKYENKLENRFKEISK